MAMAMKVRTGDFYGITVYILQLWPELYQL